ncbi:MAG: S8 family serine peptidase [Anaerolineae bacterium]|jgi:hypothetical protein|nr:S8 family serine peptidase [Anaerolineae bacterium]
MHSNLKQFLRGTVIVLLVGILIGLRPEAQGDLIPMPIGPTEDATAQETFEPLPGGESTAEPTTPAPESTVEPTVPAPTETATETPTEISTETPTATEVPPTETPLPTTEPITFDSAKLSSELTTALTAYAAGDAVTAFGVLTDYHVPQDATGAVLVDVWAAEGIAAVDIRGLIRRQGGTIVTVTEDRVTAYVPLGGLGAISTDVRVSVILVKPQAASLEDPQPFIVRAERPRNFRAPTGDAVTEGFDATGVYGWHLAGYEGGGIRVAIIDSGFGEPSVARNDDLACLALSNITLSFGTRANGDTRRGLDIVEVICDLAPDAQIRLYKATDVDSFVDALNAATTGTEASRVVMLGLDLGVHIAPGDATYGGQSGDNPYVALQQARDRGAVIVAAAGDNGTTQQTFDMPRTSGSASFSISAARGQRVNLSWNDWDNAQNGGGTRDDITAVLRLKPSLTVIGTKPSRGSASPGYQFTIPDSACAINVICEFDLDITGGTGDATTLRVQVQVTGRNSALTLDAGGSRTPVADAGTLARLADSPNVITVGAVCTVQSENFPDLTYSANGPIFALGGNAVITPSEIADYKPDFVAPSQVSVSDDQAGNCAGGFGGTSAAAAHVAGQVAVLLSNTNISLFQNPGSGNLVTTNILNYLRTRTVEKPFGNAADGYDVNYGAGLPVLGSAGYDPDTQPPLNTLPAADRIPSGRCTGGVVYAGPYFGDTNQTLGTLANPYQHAAFAIRSAANAGPNRCVVLLPGEYLSSLYINGFPNGLDVYAYASVRTGGASSTFYSQNPYAFTSTVNFTNSLKTGMIFVADFSLDFRFTGFVFAQAAVYNPSLSVTPGVLAIKDSSNVIFSTNTIRRFNTSSFTGGLIDIFETDGASLQTENITLRSNRFIENAILTEVTPTQTNVLTQMMLISLQQAGSSGGRILIEGNTFRDNVITGGSTLFNADNLDDNDPGGTAYDVEILAWRPLMRSVDSFIDLNNNTFRGNSSETLLQFATGGRRDPFQARVLGNVFVDNTITTVEGTDIVPVSSGPMIHLYYAREFYFVNNTVAYNVFGPTSGTVFGTILGRGAHDFDLNYSPLVNNGSIGWAPSDPGSQDRAAWEIHNNFFYFNTYGEFVAGSTTVPRTIVNVVKDFANVGECHQITNSVSDPNGSGFRDNWLFGFTQLIPDGDNTTVLDAGVCFAAILSGNGNITTVDPYPIDINGNLLTNAQSYILGGLDRTAPSYYSLSRNETNPALDGVDEGRDDLLTTGPLTAFGAGLDVRGVARRIDGDDSDSPDVATVDIGAYEFTPLEIVDPINIVINEDANNGIHNLELDSTYVTGGFPPYEVVITQSPRYYGIHGVNAVCDSRFTGAARGIVVEYLQDGTPIISYCLPEHFHTDTQASDFDPAGVGYSFALTDSNQASEDALVTFVINPTADDPHSTPLTYERGVGIGRNATQNTIRLRPFVNFTGNFTYSEYETSDEADYDFTYDGDPASAADLPVLVVSDPNNVEPSVIVNNLQWVDIDRGILGVNLTGVNPNTLPLGYAQGTFTYQVTDQNLDGGAANAVTHTITIIAAVPPGPFTLTTPAQNTQYAAVTSVNTFTWTVASGAQNYEFEIVRVDEGFDDVKVQLTGLTPVADSDSLTCTATVCTYTLPSIELEDFTRGTYRWQAIANNRGALTLASNAPFFFRIRIGVELLINGSFEVLGAPGLPANWVTSPVHLNRRLCRPGDAYEGLCALRVKGRPTVNSSLTQVVRNVGRATDTAVFSFFAKRFGTITTASVVVDIRQIGGQRTKRVVTINPVAEGVYEFGQEIRVPLNNTIAKGTVTIRMLGGRGTIFVDGVSLFLESDPSFVLRTPVQDEVYHNDDELVFFSWTRSIGATQYDFRLFDTTLVETPVLTLTNLTPARDADGLSCRFGICYLNLNRLGGPRPVLNNGTYRWTVEAKGGFRQTATNASYRFVVDDALSETLVNGTFDLRNGLLPLNWNPRLVTGSNVVCNNFNQVRYSAYQGTCAFNFIGGPNQWIQQAQTFGTPRYAAGNVMTLSAVVRGRNLGASRASIVATITYDNNSTETITIFVPGGTFDQTLLRAQVSLQRPVSSVRVRITNRNRSGQLTLDNVRLYNDTTP